MVLVFSTLIINPENLPKTFTVSIAFLTDARLPQNKFTSSANCLYLTSEPKIQIPSTVGFCLILFDNISAVKINRKGESEHPCLTPLQGLKQSIAKTLFKAALSICV